jgi:hypothetical protein
MLDVMYYFPEAKLSRPSEITIKLISIINNSSMYRNLQKRSLSVAKSFSGNKPKILLSWQNLIDNLKANNIIYSNPPISTPKFQFFSSNGLVLAIRILMYSILRALKLILKKE